MFWGSGEKKYERRFKKMARQHPNAVAVSIGYDEALAHRIEAGADLFLDALLVMSHVALTKCTRLHMELHPSSEPLVGLQTLVS